MDKYYSMLHRANTDILGHPNCDKVVENLCIEDFDYYDKDGFELNVAEQKFYRASGYPIDYPCLNHHCFQQPWFEIEPSGTRAGLIIDHSLILHRCSYGGHARNQLLEWVEKTPKASHLLNCRPKWGFDFALDFCVDNRTIYEVLHIEFDSTNYKEFCNKLINMEQFIRHTDWVDISNKVISKKDEWEHLKGFEQNHWKANYILGWKKAEYTEKVA